MSRYSRVPTHSDDTPLTRKPSKPSLHPSSDSDSESSPTSPLSHPAHFIKLIGTPKTLSNAAQTPTTLPLSTTGQPIKPLASSPESPNDNDNVVDVLDAQNEDPFTLEPFENLIQLHAEAGKDFILARVMTVDPNDETRFYFSYYAGHHINKVLFRTQPEEGLLHRMKAKNPLNNMTIVGDVHYYVITAASVKLMNSLTTKNTSRASIDSVSSIRSLIHNLSSAPQRTGRASELFNRYSRPKSPDGGDSGGGGMKLSRILQQAGLTVPANKRLHLVMRPTALEGTGDVAPLSPAESVFSNGESDKNWTFRSSGRPTSADPTLRSTTTENIPLLPTTSRRNSFDDAYADDSSNSKNQVRASLDSPRPQPQTNTPSYRPAPTTPRLHRRIRSTAFSNSSSKSLSIPEWIQLHAVSSNPSSQPNAPSKPPKLIITPSTTSHRRKKPTPELESQPPSPSSPTPLQTYIATYHSTDDDFLMNASIRTYFRENALESTDAVLFTIPKANEVGMMEGMEQHPALMNFVYAVAGEG
ncbi:hypothetical protein HK097_002951, partial [Rhizophlyctis rosea]